MLIEPSGSSVLSATVGISISWLAPLNVAYPKPVCNSSRNWPCSLCVNRYATRSGPCADGLAWIVKVAVSPSVTDESPLMVSLGATDDGETLMATV